jgi:predicted membrane channel-forming protein YqfA (hemolysin III family)
MVINVPVINVPQQNEMDYIKIYIYLMNTLLFFLCSKVYSYKYGDGTDLKYRLWYSNSLSI